MSELTTPSPRREDGGRVAEVTVAQELVERAREEGVDLVGPGGLLTDLTKTVLETALEAELEDHLGYPKHAVEGRDKGNSRSADARCFAAGHAIRRSDTWFCADSTCPPVIKQVPAFTDGSHISEEIAPKLIPLLQRRLREAGIL